MEWFVLKNGDVLGPYETNGVAQMFGSEADVLIWGVPFQEWLSFPDWAVRMNLGAVARSHTHQHQSVSAVAPQSQSSTINTQATNTQEPNPQAAPMAYVHDVQKNFEQDGQQSAPVTQQNPSYHQPVQEVFDADEPTAVYVPEYESSSDPVSESANPVIETSDLADESSAEVQSPSAVEQSQDFAASSDLPLEIPEDTDLGQEAGGYNEALRDLPDFNSNNPQQASSEYEAIENTADVLVIDDEQVEGTDKVEMANMPSYAFQNEKQSTAKEDSFNELEALLGDALSQIDNDGPSPQGEMADQAQNEDDEVVMLDDEMDEHVDQPIEASHDMAEHISESHADESEEQDLNLDFDGPSMENEEATRVQSLFDTDVESASAAADGDDMDLSFDGHSEATEDATRIETLLDTEARGGVEQDQDSDLGWSGSAREEDEATRVQFDDLSSSSDDVNTESDEDATRVSAAGYTGEESDDTEDATRVSASLDVEDSDEDEATRVSASSDDEDEATRVSAASNDEESDEDEATRVSASSDDDDNEEDEATRVSASDDVIDIEDLDSAEEIEVLEDEVFEAFSIEDDEEEATRVSTDSDQDHALSLEDEATRVSASSDPQPEDENFDIEMEEEEATKVSASSHESQIENFDIEDEATRVSASDNDESFDIEAEEEESTRVSAAETSVEEDLSEFEEEVTQDTDDAFMQKLSEDVASEAIDIEDGNDLGDSSGKVHDIASAKEVDQLKHLARQLKEEKVQNEDFIWYVAYEGESDGPLSLSQVLKNLDDYDVKDFVYVWREGFLDWKNLFDVPELSSGLGIGFRRHSRIQATGTVAVEFEGGTQIGQLDNLSESGIGITGIDGLHLGDIVKVKVEADDLTEVMMIVARVRFVSESGLLGLSYEKDKYPENVNKIIDFVKSKSEKMAA